MNIAVYSGSFDPVHIGHKALANYVVNHVEGIDRLLLLVTPHNPLKPEATSATFNDRMAMCSLAMQDIPDCDPSDFEAALQPPHFTYRTLTALKAAYPQDKFILLIGSDNWLIFNLWRNFDKILKDFGVMIYPRPGYPIDAATLPPEAQFLADAPVTELASTDIRESIARSEDVNKLLPRGVNSYIINHKLYGRQ